MSGNGGRPGDDEPGWLAHGLPREPEVDSVCSVCPVRWLSKTYDRMNGGSRLRFDWSVRDGQLIFGFVNNRGQSR